MPDSHQHQQHSIDAGHYSFKQSPVVFEYYTEEGHMQSSPNRGFWLSFRQVLGENLAVCEQNSGVFEKADGSYAILCSALLYSVIALFLKEAVLVCSVKCSDVM